MKLKPEHLHTTLRTASMFLFLCFALISTLRAQDTATEIEQLTNTLVASAQGANGPAGANLVSTAQKRRALLLKLFGSSPKDAQRFMLPAEVAAKLPRSLGALLETDADEQGTLEVRVEDYPDNTHRMLYFLSTAKERLQLYFAHNEPRHLLSGTRVRARGKRLDGTLLLQSGTTSNTTPAADLQVMALASPNTFGAQSTAVLLVNFQDNTAQPSTVDAMRSLVFTTLSSFDQENSQNQTWLTGDVFGWYTMPMSSSSCDTNMIASLARTAATNAGVSLSGYRRFVYAFPNTSACGGWAGLGSIGGNPSQAWINGYLNLQTIGHEMGHNFGLYHAHSLVCPGTTLGSSCSVNEYGDVFDIMGNYTASHFDAFHKEQLGWLNYGSSLPITTVSSSGAYTIPPYETGSGSKALKILKSTASATGARTWYYVEYRQPVGFDSVLSRYPASTTGVVVRSAAENDPNSSNLLDINPQTGSFADAALAVGQTYTDSAAGVTLTLVSANSSGATLNVTLGTSTCTHNNPSISITPAQASGAAGTTLSYSVSLTNNDSTSCSTGNFSLAASLPSGWTGTLGSSSLTLAPGAGGSTTLQVTSPATATAALYNTSVTATNAAATSFKSTATASYTVTSSTPPSFTLAASPTSISVVQGKSGASNVTSSISGGFSSAISWSASGMPAGVTASFSPASLPAPGSGTSTLTLSASASAVTGNYTLTVTGSGGGLTRTANVSLTVTAAPPPPPPPPPPPGGSYTLFSNSAAPAVANAYAGAGVELGMKFTSDTTGYVSGVRFYKGSSNVSTHTGSLWSSTGQLLARANFANETATGWQQVNFSTPVAVNAGAVYVVSYHSTGWFSYTLGTFNSPVDNPPLHAVLNNVSGNAVYAFSSNSVFPTTGAAGENLWVDVVFSTGTSTATLSSVTVTPVNSSIAAGATQQFHATGTYSDSSTRDLTSQVIWSSSSPAVATITSAGLATAVGAGSTSIRASLGAISGATTLSVTGTPPPPPPPPPAGGLTLFSSTAVPAVANSSAGASLEMGMQFTADRNGFVTGVRFYKGTANTGLHVGSLWSSSGQLLGQATFTNESASGWQQVNFSSPVAITANTQYVISYHSSGNFSYTLGTFNIPVDNPPLHAVSNRSGSNGVYAFGAGSVFPTIGAAGENLWVDVVFQ